MGRQSCNSSRHRCRAHYRAISVVQAPALGAQGNRIGHDIWPPSALLRDRFGVKRWLALEVAFLAACAVLAWWIGAHGTTAWLARVERLDLEMPVCGRAAGELAVRAAAHSASV